MICLSLGTNLGDKEQNLRNAIDAINMRIGPIVAQSAFFVTEPWGFESANSFLNACIAVETSLTPRQLLRVTQQIERQLGRKTKSNGTYHDRLIDIDILLYDDRIVCEPDLQIPHPLMAQRRFVLEPLDQIAHDQMVPGTLMSVGEMFKALAANE